MLVDIPNMDFVEQSTLHVVYYFSYNYWSQQQKDKNRKHPFIS